MSRHSTPGHDDHEREQRSAAVLSRNARSEFLESPGGLGLCLVWHGWTALSSVTPTWVRIGAGILAAASLVLLARTLTSRPRTPRPTHTEAGTTDI